jgi:hypothetical protein
VLARVGCKRGAAVSAIVAGRDHIGAGHFCIGQRQGLCLDNPIGLATFDPTSHSSHPEPLRSLLSPWLVKVLAIVLVGCFALPSDIVPLADLLFALLCPPF